MNGKKNQKGWVSGREAARRADHARRRQQIRQAQRGKAQAPAYKEENNGCPLALLLLPLHVLTYLLRRSS